MQTATLDSWIFLFEIQIFGRVYTPADITFTYKKNTITFA